MSQPLRRDAACRVSPASVAAASGDAASHVSTGNSQSVLARRGGAIMKKSSCDQTVLMKSRIFLLLFAFHILACSLIGQTAPPTSKPAAPPAGTPTSSAPAPATSTPAAQTPAGQAPAQPGNPAKSDPAKPDSDESVATIVHVVNEVRVVFTVTDRHGRYIKDLKRDDFKVIDDQKPAELRSFRSETDLFGPRPLQVRAGSGNRVSECHHSPAL